MLSINNEEDIAKIIQTIPNARYEDIDLIKKFLPNDPMWHKIGIFDSVVLGSGKNKVAVRFTELIEIAHMISELDGAYANLDLIIKKLHNIPQVESTFFEIRAAYTCHNTIGNKGITFLDDRNGKGGPKTPEFCWHTETGDIYVECKTINLKPTSNNPSKKLDAIHTAQNTEYYKLSWPKATKLIIGVALPLKGSFGERLVDAIKGAHQHMGKMIQIGEFTALASGESFSPEEGSIVMGSATVKQAGRPQRLVDATDTLTYMPYSSNLVRMLKKTLNEARKQISVGNKGIIFIQMPRVTASVTDLIINSLNRGEFAHITAIIVVDPSGLHHKYSLNTKKD